MYKISKHEQGSPAWFQDRLGKWTASIFSKALTPTGKKSSQADEIINRLVAEKIVGYPDETFQNDAMLRGQDLEHEALEFLNFTHGYNFKPTGFIQSLEDEFGASADATDRDAEIGLEMKCPSLHTHIEYITAGGLPNKYKAQVQGGMMVTGWKKWVFMSYHPEVKPLVIIVERDEEYIQNLKKVILECCEEVRKKHKAITEYLND